MDVISSFKDAETERIFQGLRSRSFDAIAKSAYRKLAILHSARTLHDLKSPGLQLEALKDDRAASTVFASTTDTASALSGGTAKQATSKSWTTIRRKTAMTMKPPHPGETIKEEYLVPLGMSTTALAKELGIGAPRLNEIVRGRRSVTADTALRLARYFGTTPELWINLQSFYDLRMAQRKAGKTIERQVTPRRAA
jgi:addiction module HigA family antidote